MIACLCNGIPDRFVLDAIAAGARTYNEVLAILNSEPVCETCRGYIEDQISYAIV